MKSTLFAVLSAAFLTAALTVPEATSALDAAAARGTMGGECWGPNPKFLCQQVAICDTLNWNNVISCPTENPWCFFCSNGNRQVWNCVQNQSGGECDRQPGGTDCGYLVAGTCSGSVCVTAFDVGTCDDGPDCDGDCP